MIPQENINFINYAEKFETHQGLCHISPMFEKYSHPMLYVNNLGRAVDWYKDVLGFETLFHTPNRHASLFHSQLNLRLDLHPQGTVVRDVGFGCINYFATKTFDRTIAQLRGKNVNVSLAKQEGSTPRFVTFWDSEGNALGLEEML